MNQQQQQQQQQEEVIDVDAEVVDLVSDSEDEQDVVVHYTLDIPGPPKAMPRPTFMAWIRNGFLMRRVMNKAKEKVKTTRLFVINELKQKYGLQDHNFPLFPTGAVRLSCTFARRIPNDMFPGQNRNNRITRINFQEDGPFIGDVKVPDIDNLAKFILDVLQGVVYQNDQQVVFLLCYKVLDVQHPHNGNTTIHFEKFRNA